jgi:site-specific recombinase
MYIVWSYSAYLIISLAITIWVARTLHKNGRLFLIEAFHSNSELADSVSRLLLVGFYLVNIGSVACNVRFSEQPGFRGELVWALVYKVGSLLLISGLLYFPSLYLLSKMRKGQ